MENSVGRTVSLNDSVSYSNGNFTVATTVAGTAGDIIQGYDYYRNWWYPTFYPYSSTTILQEDKGIKAKDILCMLMDKKLVSIRTVKDFVNMMDEIIKIL